MTDFWFGFCVGFCVLALMFEALVIAHAVTRTITWPLVVKI
jgi:hypothetical protein